MVSTRITDVERHYGSLAGVAIAATPQRFAEACTAMLALVMDVDFEVEGVVQTYDPAWWRKVEAGELSRDALREKANESWNVARELQVRLRAVKG